MEDLRYAIGHSLGEGLGHHDPLGHLLAPMKRRIDSEVGAEAFRRDPEMIRHFISVLERGLRYFKAEVRGIEHVPLDGPALVVGNHCGATWMPDAGALFAALVRHRGIDRPTYSLGYDLLFAVPGMNRMLRRCGVLPANPANAAAALEQKAAVIVYPGGDWESCRPWTERHRVELHQRMGFVRLALRSGVPVVPVVAHGSHESIIVLTRGDRLAHVAGLDRLRINVFPMTFGFPFGLTPPFLPTVPLPTKVTVEVLEPLDWTRWYGGDNEPEVVRRCYDEMVGVLQRGLDRLASEEGNSLVARFRRHRPAA
jgi:1-acyl-sn-glycerol-3-phosphate acyltransferase